MLIKNFVWEGKKEGESDELDFFSDLFLNPSYPKVRFKFFCELLGRIIQSACLVWGVVDSLALILVIHNYGKCEISFAIPNRERYHILWYICHTLFVWAVGNYYIIWLCRSLRAEKSHLEEQKQARINDLEKSSLTVSMDTLF